MYELVIKYKDEWHAQLHQVHLLKQGVYSEIRKAEPSSASKSISQANVNTNTNVTKNNEQP